jgi:hypothetical protein
MDSLRLPSLNHRSLLILYGSSVVTLLPFGFLYAYAVGHGLSHSVAFWACLSVGLLASLIVWSRLEHVMLDPARQAFTANVNVFVSSVVFQSGEESSGQAYNAPVAHGTNIMRSAA